ncbi:PREDICTED: lipid phosphate phosphohydrolase 2 isoform X3 [Propithecus coquereli]|uniref:lipid phosphate phosphohydrolase 2 isoform X3 n=1 Tax=Propithecus coquereli TaxID=379532 RepID=UPI00063F5D57|nr:PREDICTED: lipid phosphate phosphohydrolase 2 isoform X3 [Propithecus coquereli]
MERRWVFVLLDVLCLLVASLPFAILTLVNTPYKRGFYCGDDSIRYPYRPDTITHGLMAGVTITATAVLVSAGEAYLVYTDRLYSRSDFNNYAAALYKVLGTFLFGAAVSQSLTDLAKYMTGRLRPSFLAVCDPDWSRVNCSVYVQVEKVCRGSPANVTEARRGSVGSGRGCCGPQFSSSWWPLHSTWGTPECLTTNTTGATSLLASCRGRWWLASPSAMSQTSSKPGPRSTARRRRSWSGSPACR